MDRHRTVWAVVALVCALACPAQALDTVYLVRHAEKQADWPADRAVSAMQPLSEAGMRRALALAGRMADVPLVAVLGSPTTRSIHTGLFTARAQGIEIRVEPATIDRTAIADLLAALREEHAGAGAVLIVGHSNTIPWFFDAVGVDASCHARLGVTEESYGLATEGYGGLWEVDLDARGCDAVTRHEFGDAHPERTHR